MTLIRHLRRLVLLSGAITLSVGLLGVYATNTLGVLEGVGVVLLLSALTTLGSLHATWENS